MPKLYLDTSAFLKLYRAEVGSNWLKNFVIGNELIISQLTLFESANTLARLYREGFFTRLVALGLYRQIRRDSRKLTLLPLGTPQQLRRATSIAFNLTGGLRLRTLDAIQLATAIQAEEVARSLTPPVPFLFVSSDSQLLQVARSIGLVVENPEDHP
jgi:predicted nucleic acid-binding protein